MPFDDIEPPADTDEFARLQLKRRMHFEELNVEKIAHSRNQNLLAQLTKIVFGHMRT